RLQREGLERLLWPVALLLDARVRRAGVEVALRHLDALGAEGIDLALGGIGHRLVGLHLGQRVHPAAEVLRERVEFLLEVAMLLAAAGGKRERRDDQEALSHFLPFFAAALALRCCASSWSSR